MKAWTTVSLGEVWEVLECWICFEGKVNKVCRKTGCRKQENKSRQAWLQVVSPVVVERIKLFNEIGNTGRWRIELNLRYKFEVPIRQSHKGIKKAVGFCIWTSRGEIKPRDVKCGRHQCRWHLNLQALVRSLHEWVWIKQKTRPRTGHCGIPILES